MFDWILNTPLDVAFTTTYKYEIINMMSCEGR